jgi:lysophospholipid acyltransferase (LPLAT)-like uncharacterized protein
MQKDWKSMNVWKAMRKRLISAFGTLVLKLYYQILVWTVSYEFVGRDEMEAESRAGRSLVLGIAHGSLLAVISAWDGWPATLLASQSKDGELASQLLESRGFRVVRGSSSRGGKEALANLLQSCHAGEIVGITFDGPRGPALVPKAGVAVCASQAAAGLFFAWIEPLPNRFLGRPFIVRLRSWDRFVLPLPFARIRVHHERIVPPELSPKTQTREWIACALKMLENRAREVYGS